MNHKKSSAFFQDAQKYLPGGVDSPVRAFKAVGGHPIFVSRGKGSKIYDEDNNEYIDYVCSWGPLILGHSHPYVMKELAKALKNGTSFGTPTVLETTLARMIISAMPSMQMIRFVNSGTEAVMSALRLARAYTKKDKIVKFAGCYHGHYDGLLARSGSGLSTLGIPDSPGVPSSIAQNTLIAQFNDMESIKKCFNDFPVDIAAVIIEPIAANMGVIHSSKDFLQSLRNLCSEFNSLLIFDEVITGFRVGYGGAQGLYNIQPDLTCLGKIIGGGLPVGAYGGRSEIMEMVAPSGKVYQAGTLSGNPLAMTAGIATLELLGHKGIYDELEKKTMAIESGLGGILPNNGINFKIVRAGSLLTIFFAKNPVMDFSSALLSDTSLFGTFFHRLLDQGIYWPPSQFEAAFVSLAHSDNDIQKTVCCISEALKSLRI